MQATNHLSPETQTSIIHWYLNKKREVIKYLELGHIYVRCILSMHLKRDTYIYNWKMHSRPGKFTDFIIFSRAVNTLYFTGKHHRLFWFAKSQQENTTDYHCFFRNTTIRGQNRSLTRSPLQVEFQKKQPRQTITIDTWYLAAPLSSTQIPPIKSQALRTGGFVEVAAPCSERSEHWKTWNFGFAGIQGETRWWCW